MSAEIIWLGDRHMQTDNNLEIDPWTAIDFAVRDLAEIEALWGTDRALEHLAE